MRLLESYHPSKDRFVVFHTPKGCGGLGDRVMGLLSAAVLALLTQRQFRVRWNEPFPLSRAWSPRHELLPWDKEDHGDRSFAKLSLIDTALGAREWLVSADLQRELPENILVEANQHFFSYLLRNRSLQSTNVDGEDAARTTVELLRALFQPTPELRALLAEWRSPLGESGTVGLQIRTLWNFGDGGGPIGPGDLGRLWACVQELVRKGQADRVFVTADDAAIIDETKRQLDGTEVLAVDSPILHLDRSASTDQRPFLHLFVSLHALASCQHLVISHWSNFGRLAAFLANREPWVTRKESGGCAVPSVQEDYRIATLMELVSKDDKLTRESATI